MFVRNNIFHSRFYIFVKCTKHINHENLLQILGVTGSQIYTEITKKSYKSASLRKMYVFKDLEWVHLMDSLRFDMYHNKKFMKKIKELEFDVFFCVFDDTSDGYEFFYKKDNKVIRDVNLYDPYRGDKIFLKDYGKRLSIEEKIMDANGDSIYSENDILEIARSIGVNLEHTMGEIMQYELIQYPPFYNFS